MAGPVNINLSGTHSARVAISTYFQGRTFYETDTGTLWYDTGSAWSGPITIPAFVASGASHAAGAVPDPGSTSGSTKFLREDATWAVPAGGGGGSGAMTNIAETIVAGSVAASITFSSIPGTSRNLRLVCTARGDTAAQQLNVQMQFNGDTGSNYQWVYMDIYQSGADAGNSVGAPGTYIMPGKIPGASASANVAGPLQIDIHDYARTAWYKHTVGRWFYLGQNTWVYTGNSNPALSDGVWNSTAAITSITLTPAAGNFAIGSVFTLYGIL